MTVSDQTALAVLLTHYLKLSFIQNESSMSTPMQHLHCKLLCNANQIQVKEDD